MTQVTNSREAGAEGMQQVWVLQVSESDDTATPIVSATKETARSRAAAEANGVDLEWQEDEQGVSIAKAGQTVFTIFATPVHQF